MSPWCLWRWTSSRQGRMREGSDQSEKAVSSLPSLMSTSSEYRMAEVACARGDGEYQTAMKIKKLRAETS